MKTIGWEVGRCLGTLAYEETGRIHYLSVYLPTAQFKELIRVCLPCGDGWGVSNRKQAQRNAPLKKQVI